MLAAEGPSPFILLGSAVDLKSQKPWVLEAKLGRAPNIGHVLCQSQSSLSDPPSELLFKPGLPA